MRGYFNFATALVRAQMPTQPARISVAFRCKLVLMIFNAHAFGDHVVDEQAFILRCRRLPWLATPLLSRRPQA